MNIPKKALEQAKDVVEKAKKLERRLAERREREARRESLMMEFATDSLPIRVDPVEIRIETEKTEKVAIDVELIPSDRTKARTEMLEQLADQNVFLLERQMADLIADLTASNISGATVEELDDLMFNAGLAMCRHDKVFEHQEELFTQGKTQVTPEEFEEFFLEETRGITANFLRIINWLDRQ